MPPHGATWRVMGTKIESTSERKMRITGGLWGKKVFYLSLLTDFHPLVQSRPVLDSSKSLPSWVGKFCFSSAE